MPESEGQKNPRVLTGFKRPATTLVTKLVQTQQNSYGLMTAFRADKQTQVASKRFKLLKIVAAVLGSSALFVLLTGALLWNALFAQMPELPNKEALWAMNREPAIEFQDINGETLSIRGPRYGKLVRPAELPLHVLQAFLAVEDKRFYEHEGVDRLAIMRAAFVNWRAGETVQGASTLTQQLVKNLFLSPEKTLRRKAQEARLAFELEEMLSKEEILELYLNRVYLGARAFGLDAASRRYFGKEPQELTLAEAALIAGLPKAPSRFSPMVNPDMAIRRRNLVIDRMADAGYITPIMAQQAKLEDVAIVEQSTPPWLGYALDMAAEQARNLTPETAPDMVITLTIDTTLQEHAHLALNALLEEHGEDKRASQASMLVMDHDGAIRAVVGGKDYSESQFNRATQARRQPGSAFKAFVFAAALEEGLHPYSVRTDEPIKIDDWRPKNYGGRYVGPVTLSEAFATSLNTVAAQIGQEVSLEKVISLAHRFGVRSALSPYPSLALGSDEVTLAEMVQAYGTFATGGKRVTPWLVAEVRNSRGDTLYKHETEEQPRVFADGHNRAMVGMMARVVRRGTGKSARLTIEPEEDETTETEVRSNVPRDPIYRDVAGKTGTSQDWRDAVFVGFTGDYIAGVWVGNDDDTPMRRVTGGDLPAQLWHDVMAEAHKDLPAIELPGAEAADKMTTEAEKKLAFYRSLADAFAAAEAREVKLGGNDTLR